MKVSSALICGFLFTAFPAFGQSKDAQEKTTTTTGHAQIVSTAEIVKIDAKKKSLQVRELAQPTNNTGRRNGQGGGGYPRSGGRPDGAGRRRPGGVGFPGSGGGGYPGRTGGTSTNQAKEYKVFVTKDTVMTLANQNIEFNDLRVGDRIDISGTPKGGKGDLEATSIARNLK